MGWLCVVPPLLTIGMAIVTKRVVLSLLAGIALGVLVLLPSPEAQQAAWGDSFTWPGYFVDAAAAFVAGLLESHLWTELVEADHLRVFAFTVLLGMQVAMIHRMGGMLGIVNWAAPLAKTRRGGQLLTWMLGLVVFIDDYANTLLLGSTMRPITDRLKISREKLAFLVDTTAAPVSGLALVSTWVAGEISYMKEGYEAAQVDIGGDAFAIFVETIPSRFYVLLALAFVFLCSWLGRDFGPMLAAERRARAQTDPPQTLGTERAQVANGWNAVVPILGTIGVVVWLMIATGHAELGAPAWPSLSDLSGWGVIINAGDSYVALLYGALAGLILSLLLNAGGRVLPVEKLGATLLEGFLHVFPALIILWLAWTLSGLTDNDHLATGSFLAGKIEQLNVTAAWMPTAVFLLSAGIAFATGTSWGTMGIVMPIIVPLVYSMIEGDAVPANHFIMTASIGSVLAGAIFGDHCSPISDTTILSSKSSDCDHIAHVRTQMPYALTIGAVSIVCGTLPVGFGVSCWLLLPAGVVALGVILRLCGRTE